MKILRTKTNLKLWEEYNEAMSTAIDEDAPNFEGEVRMVEGMKSLEMTNDDFGVDCFHPSEAGQRKIAKVFIDEYKKTLD